VHALFPSDPTLYSPYSASSRHALNVMFIDVTAVLEVQGSRARAGHHGGRRLSCAARAGARGHAGGLCGRRQLKMTVLRAASSDSARDISRDNGARRGVPRVPARARRALRCTRCSMRSTATFGGITARAPGGTTGPRSIARRLATPCGGSRTSMPTMWIFMATCNGSRPSS
jgi:hypothetical protein